MAVIHAPILTHLRSADAVPPKVRGSFANTALAAQTSSPSFTLPTGIQNGDEAFAIVSFNSAVVTLTGQAGWTLIEGPVTNSTSTLRSYLLRKTLTAAESGTVVTFTLDGGGRWHTGGIVLISADVANTVSTLWVENTDDTTLSIPSTTPAANKDYMLVVLAAARYATTTTGITAAGQWVETAEASTTNTTAPLFGVWIGTNVVPKDTAGYATPAQDMVYAGTARNNAWILAIPYKTATTPGRIAERWTGSALVPVRSDKWNGTALVQQTSEV